MKKLLSLLFIALACVNAQSGSRDCDLGVWGRSEVLIEQWAVADLPKVPDPNESTLSLDYLNCHVGQFLQHCASWKQASLADRDQSKQEKAHRRTAEVRKAPVHTRRPVFITIPGGQELPRGNKWVKYVHEDSAKEPRSVTTRKISGNTAPRSRPPQNRPAWR